MHGQPASGDDSILEKSNKTAKNLKRIIMPVSGKHHLQLYNPRRFKKSKDGTVIPAARSRTHGGRRRGTASTAQQMALNQAALALRRAARRPCKHTAVKTETLQLRHNSKTEAREVLLKSLDDTVAAGRAMREM